MSLGLDGGTEPHHLAKTTVLYRYRDALDEDILESILQERTRIHSRKSSAHGVVSRVYKLAQQSSSDDEERGSQARLCIKRVVEEDQVAPHSVHREIAAYKAVQEQESQSRQHLMQLFVALQDDSDPFSVTIDLVMPWIPCTLQALLEEPETFVPVSWQSDNALKTADENASNDRPALALLKQVRDRGRAHFALHIAKQVFAALLYLHEKCAIAHRDVKPSNIVIDAQLAQARLIDFGTCHFVGVDGALRDPRRDDGKGGIVSEVGTGAYRAPECLLSPSNGYDACAVDIWQAGATLVEFMTPLIKVDTTKSGKRHGHDIEKREVADEEGISPSALRALAGRNGTEQYDDHLNWEKALWADDDGDSWSRLRSEDIQGQARHDTNDRHEHQIDFGENVTSSKTDSGWLRASLFEGSGGDLRLASSIFNLRGLPEADDSDGRGGSALWPEATDMHPPLAKLPFARQPADPRGLGGRLRDLQNCDEEKNTTKRTKTDDAEVTSKLVDVIDACLQLSASKRLTARQAHERLAAIE